MALLIDRDYKRFREIVKGKVRKDLRRYMSHGEMIVPRGKNAVSIPLPRIDIPHFRYDDKKQEGVGQGEGDPGTPLAPGDPSGQPGGAGNQPGGHILEVELTYDELVEILAEALELPHIEPRGKEDIYADKDRYTGLSRKGPESLRHFKRTYREALKRMLISGEYLPHDPVVIPIKEDRRYRSWKTQRQPIAKAVILYAMDISGSMGHEQKEIVRLESFWIDLWIRHHYTRTETVYIVHDAVAREVDRNTFFHLREGGGTRISSAYKLMADTLKNRFSPDEWNIYIFQFSDGDNWNGGDSDTCIDILKSSLLPAANLFCYGQVKSAYGSGDFYYSLEPLVPDHSKLILSRIEDKDQIYDSIKTFLGKAN